MADPLWQSLSDHKRLEIMRDRRRRDAYRTEICKTFQRSGDCPYGVRCSFAHSQEDLGLRKVRIYFLFEGVLYIVSKILQ